MCLFVNDATFAQFYLPKLKFGFDTNLKPFIYRASDRGDSPWCSSLNHSYETLNMPDSGSDHDPTATPQKNPHRPAPPVPATGSPVAKSTKKDSTEENLDAIEVESLYSVSSKSRRKAKHPLSRRTLRQRKIHSLKRQIQIKEKMLEVNFLKIFIYSNIFNVIPRYTCTDLYNNLKKPLRIKYVLFHLTLTFSKGILTLVCG